MTKQIVMGLFVALFISCNNSKETKKENSNEFSVNYEKIELKNGLDVVFHVDKSDPVVGVELAVHVGSSREKTGRTGFAHLFEHLLFLESENLGKGGLDKMSARIGGSGANGSTSRDVTVYLQTVPNDALEKMIWAEADKLGWFINTVTDPVLAKEKQVVKNEKRQSNDNAPYGYTSAVIDKNLYPEGHPYSWQVIGSLTDLQNATLNDVKDFFKKWYVPNNATLVISGDFDIAKATEWVHKYFDEIPRGEAIVKQEKQAAVVSETKQLYYEDNFARLPELTLTWPTVERFHPDSYPLTVLAQYLSRGKKAPLNTILVDELALTARSRMYNWSSEIAGQFQLAVRAYAGKDLDDVAKGITKAFEKFETEGISEKDLERIKAGQETNFYNSLSSVLGKGSQLANYNIFANEPGFASKDIENILAVSTNDVMRVYKKYIQNKNYIGTSFIPKGNLALAIEGSEVAVIEEEIIVQGAEENFDASIAAEYEKTPSTFDRSQEPPYGNAPQTNPPKVWEDTLANGLKVYGVENNEVALVQFNIVIDGGQLLEDINKLGIANLTADLMNKGTKNKTVAELEETIEQLGASIDIYAGKESVRISGTTLSKNYNATLALVEEILLEPRWDEKEFELLKKNAVSSIRQQEASPNAIARNAYNELIYGAKNIRSKNTLGTIASVNEITIADLKNYYKNYISPSVAKMHIVGSISKDDALVSLTSFADKWKAKDVIIPVYKTPAAPSKATVYFYDVPNAKQSVLNFGAPALAANDTDFYPATVMNYILGGGGFASKLTQELREGKGYTYGIRSRFGGTKAKGAFTISSGVRSNVTLESAQLVKQILENYPKEYSETDLATTKSFLIKSNARAFETMRAKLGMLEDISTYNLKYDYVKDRETIVNNMTIERIQELSNTYLNPNKMIWLVVGDAKTQLKRLEKLGFGTPILLNPVEKPIKD